MSIDITRPWASMFADASANLHDLPPELLKTHKALTRVRERVATHRQAAPNPAAAHRETVAKLKAAAATGRGWPDAAAIRQAETDATDHGRMGGVLELTDQELAGELVAGIADQADAIVTDYLRPVHDRMVAVFREAARAIPDPPNTDALMRADDKVRKAWLDLDGAVTTYTRMRDTAERLNRLTPVQNDVAGEFSSMRNVREVWTDWQIGRTPPWTSTDSRVSMLWLARHGADLWLPTSAERDAAWWAKYGEQAERARAGRHDLQGYGAVFG